MWKDKESCKSRIEEISNNEKDQVSCQKFNQKVRITIDEMLKKIIQACDIFKEEVNRKIEQQTREVYDLIEGLALKAAMFDIEARNSLHQ